MISLISLWAHHAGYCNKAITMDRRLNIYVIYSFINREICDKNGGYAYIRGQYVANFQQF